MTELRVPQDCYNMSSGSRLSWSFIKKKNNLTTLACQRLQHRLWQETRKCSSMGKVFKQTCICADLGFSAKATAAFRSQVMTLWPEQQRSLGSCSASAQPCPGKPSSSSPPNHTSRFSYVCPSHYCCAGPLSINVVFSVEFSLACSLLYKTAAYLTVCPS